MCFRSNGCTAVSSSFCLQFHLVNFADLILCFVCSGDFSSLNWGSIPVVVVLTSLKLLLAVAISLVINNWWTFGDGGGNHLIDSCSNPTPGYCHSYCNDVVVIDVEFTTDDFTLVVVDNSDNTVLVDNKTSHENNNPYCIAEFRSNCS
jgi:hypothetical protein